MTSSLKAILFAAGAATLVASPVLAKTHYRVAPWADVLGWDEPAPRAFVRHAPRRFVTPYGANVPQPAHAPSVNPDFQVPGNSH
jgi:hypothetical protein